MFWLISIVFLSRPLVFQIQCQSISTIPDTSNQNAYIAIYTGENTTVVCTVFSTETNQLQTPWRIRRLKKDSGLRKLQFAPDGLPTEVEFIGHFIATGKQIPMIQNTYRTNLTFFNFTNEFDTTQLQCGDTAIETRNFFLGFPG